MKRSSGWCWWPPSSLQSPTIEAKAWQFFYIGVTLNRDPTVRGKKEKKRKKGGGERERKREKGMEGEEGRRRWGGGKERKKKKETLRFQKNLWRHHQTAQDGSFCILGSLSIVTRRWGEQRERKKERKRVHFLPAGLKQFVPGLGNLPYPLMGSPLVLSAVSSLTVIVYPALCSLELVVEAGPDFVELGTWSLKKSYHDPGPPHIRLNFGEL